jgi:hypothetical protein
MVFARRASVRMSVKTRGNVRLTGTLSETFGHRPTCATRHADGEMVCFKRSKSFHGMRPRRLSSYLRVSLGGPASGEPLEGKKKIGSKGREEKKRAHARASEQANLFYLVARTGPGSFNGNPKNKSHE